MAASHRSVSALVCATLVFSSSVHAETVLYAGVQYDTDRSAAQCWLSDRSGNLRATGNIGVRHDLVTVGRWSFTLKAEHVSCFGATDMNDTNSVGAQVEFRLFD